MKAKAVITTFVAGVLLSGALLTVQRSSSEVSASRDHGPEPWAFKEGRGVTLSDAAKKALGLEVVSVESASIAPEHRGFSAQVFRTAEENPSAKQAGASVWLPSREATNITAGQMVRLTRGETAFTSRVFARKESAPGQQPNVELLLDVDDPGAALRVGDFLSASLSDSPDLRIEATVVPSLAIVDSIRGNFVYAVNGGAFLRTPVKLGARQGDKVEVVDGLFEGDEIVTRGASDLWLVELQAVNGGKGCADGH